MQERLLMRERRNRLIRWLIIAVSVMILFPLYYPSPWSPKTAVRQTLEGMALPSDTIEVVSMIQTGSMYSVLFYDEEHELYTIFSWTGRSAFSGETAAEAVGIPLTRTKS